MMRTAEWMSLFLFASMTIFRVSAEDLKNDKGGKAQSSITKDSKELDQQETVWQGGPGGYDTRGWANNNKGWSNRIPGGNVPQGGYGGYGMHGDQGLYGDRGGDFRGWNSNYGASKGWNNPGTSRPSNPGWPNYISNRDWSNYGDDWRRTKGWQQGYGSSGTGQYPYDSRWSGDGSTGGLKGYYGGYGSYGSGAYGNQLYSAGNVGASYGNQKGWNTRDGWGDRRMYGRGGYPGRRYGDYGNQNDWFRQGRRQGNFKGTNTGYDNYWPPGSGRRGLGFSQNTGW